MKDRHIFEFNNGIYITYEDKWIPLDNPEYKNYNPSKHFDINFDTSTIQTEDPINRYNNPFNIITDKCENFKNIMSYQEWPEDVQRWLCILIGRMLYSVGEKDSWQTAPYLLGQSGSGKSTIINIVKKFYDYEDIGILSNNVGNFDFSTIYDKYLFIAPELNSNFNIEPADFQTLISGEDMAIKSKTNIKNVTWSVHGIFCGNEIRKFSDTQFSKRLFMFLFTKKLEDNFIDTKLSLKLEKEIGHILHACNRLYLDMVERCDSLSVWDVCPQYFKNQLKPDENIDALTSFLQSNEVIIDSDLYVPESILIEAFNEYCKEKQITKHRWTTQYYLGIFSNFDIVRKRFNDKKGLKYPKENGSERNGMFCLGVDVVKNLTASPLEFI